MSKTWICYSLQKRFWYPPNRGYRFKFGTDAMVVLTNLAHMLSKKICSGRIEFRFECTNSVSTTCCQWRPSLELYFHHNMKWNEQEKSARFALEQFTIFLSLVTFKVHFWLKFRYESSIKNYEKSKFSPWYNPQTLHFLTRRFLNVCYFNWNSFSFGVRHTAN